MYINDLTKYLNDCKVILYADDTALYSSCESNVELMMNLNIELGVAVLAKLFFRRLKMCQT